LNTSLSLNANNSLNSKEVHSSFIYNSTMDSTQPVTVPQPVDELESTVEVEVEVKPLSRPLGFTDLPAGKPPLIDSLMWFY
jgi:hypothetical protein